MSIDLGGMNTAELKKLTAQIEKRIVEVEKETLETALKKMYAVAEKHSVDFEDVVALHGRKGKGKKTASKNAPKYVNPNDPAQTWTGRGRKPAWVKTALEAGKSIDDLTI